MLNDLIISSASRSQRGQLATPATGSRFSILRLGMISSVVFIRLCNIAEGAGEMASGVIVTAAIATITLTQSVRLCRPRSL
ncbi:hypothetical protein BBB56_10640 [Candidatus Pantoea deserta]|uniref:Uncharacterized protein n=1 Tax=Candidatus Pantoea deserta TaxID=1869313 RepID=A0A3N4NZG1_9GAMM|nr:hypothetical protein BBB56_10640 [Pantoea deserta]